MKKSRIRRPLVYVGVLCSLASFVSLLLSLAMPGIGWLVAASALIVTSLLVPLIGKKYVVTTFVIDSIHLFTFGPLSLLGQSGPLQLPAFYFIVFIIIPGVVGLISMSIPSSMLYTKRKS